MSPPHQPRVETRRLAFDQFDAHRERLIALSSHLDLMPARDEMNDELRLACHRRPCLPVDDDLRIGRSGLQRKDAVGTRWILTRGWRLGPFAR